MTPSLVPAIRSRSVSRALFVSGVVVLVLLFVLPIEVQETVEVPGRVLPAQEWVVVRNSGGALSAIRRDYRTGAVEATFTAEPARGDAVQFELGPAAAAHAVAAGDTVGFFASGETALRMATLRGAVDAARAELRLYQSGEKASLVEAARQDFRYAQTALEQATREADRQCSLAARGVVTEQACEDAGSARRLAAAGAAAAEARLEAVRTGARAEAITLARTRLASLEQEAATLAERFEMGTLVAPISGMTYRVFSHAPHLPTRSLPVVSPIRSPASERLHEKLSGIQVRRKLRIRAYDLAGHGNPTFLEVKRKHGGAVWKDRAALDAGTVTALLGGGDPSEAVPLSERVAAARLIYRLRREARRPTLLVTYDREPSSDGSTLRSASPSIGGSDAPRTPYWASISTGLYAERGLRPALVGRFILEVKFDRVFPSWLRARHSVSSASGGKRSPSTSSVSTTRWPKLHRGASARAAVRALAR